MYVPVIRSFVIVVSILLSTVTNAAQHQPVKALYIPLADHYAAVIAYDRYRKHMQHADFKIEQMTNWNLLRAKFQSGSVDMAFIMSPLAMAMYNQKANFQWIGLMHRDGNALAINELLNSQVTLEKERRNRKPSEEVAVAIKKAYLEKNRSIEIGLPHLLSTHTVVLHRYLKENGLRLSLAPNEKAEVHAIAVAPSKSPYFIKNKNTRYTAAAFEQSLPWADIVETKGFGKVAWYSKDVMPWPNGHVECITVATDAAIAKKKQAIKEVMEYIHKAGDDIEKARTSGGKALNTIVEIIHRYIPEHTKEAIIASLDPELRVINYEKLNIDKAGLNLIMEYALDAGVLKKPVNINKFANDEFAVDLKNE